MNKPAQQENLNKPLIKKEYNKPTLNIASTLSIKEIIKDLAEKILNRNIIFGPEEYKNLSGDDLKILREYQKEFEESDHKIHYMKEIAEYFSDGIQEEFPDGFILVGIGRSPAFLVKYMEFQGFNVKYCPISNISSHDLHVTEAFKKAYKKYLDNIGLTKDFIEGTKKPIIFTDYIFYGDTMRNFKKLLALPEFDLLNDKMEFRDIATFIGEKIQKDNLFDQEDDIWEIYNKIFDQFPLVKDKYTSIPRVNARTYGEEDSDKDEFNKYYKNNNRFEEDFNTKMINFILAEEIHKKDISD